MPTLKRLNIPHSSDFSFAKFLAVPTEVRDWNIQGLPSDTFSIENGILVARGNRFPLMIDPQGQANKWIKAREPKLKALSLKTEGYMRIIESSLQLGLPVLIQDVGEELDPALEVKTKTKTTNINE